MTGNTLGWVIVAFVLYLLMMIAIGALYAKGNNNSEDYFLGGRKLNGFVAALSAQASDMSGWLLMGLPGAIYLTGVGGDGWIAIGLFIGTTLNWLLIATKLRRYTIRANNSVTLPTYFENRFHDEKKVLMTVSSITIVVFFLVYCASALSAGGQLFESVFGIDYHVALTIGALVVLVYTFLGGFTAVCVTDFIQGMLMLVGILAVPLFAYHFLTIGGTTLSAGLEASGADSANFLNLMKNGDGSNNIVSVISGLGWGLGYFGMPHILLRFMAIEDEKKLKLSRRVASVWVVIAMGIAILIGVIGYSLMMKGIVPQYADNAAAENVVVDIAKFLSKYGFVAAFAGGIILAGILASTMSTADSQLLAAASSISENLVQESFGVKLSTKKAIGLARIAVVVISVIAIFLARDPDSSVFRIVSFAWAGFGAAFGPVVLCALFWKRANKYGAISGMLAGGAMVFIWKFLVRSAFAGTVLDIYELLPAFIVGLAVIIVVSLLTKAPDKEITDKFDEVKAACKEV